MSDLPRLPFASPEITESDIEVVADVLRSGWVTTGPQSAAFESEFAEFVGGDVSAIAVNSATAGLHLALEACGIGPGDEVIIPTWTFTATAEVVRYLGATPVLVDVEPSTLNIDLNQVARTISNRTRAIMPVHFAGRAVDMAALAALVGDRPIRIVEDAAHALPTMRDGTTVGSCAHSDAAVFSFYANKTMTTGEGGMVTTTDEALARRMRTMRLHGIDRDVFNRYQSERPAWQYDVVAPGFKYNLTDPAAALGRAQLRRVSDMAASRSNLAARYADKLDGLPLQLPPGVSDDDQHAWHLFVVELGDEAGVSRDAVAMELATLGIGTSVHFIPLHTLSYWRSSLDLDDVPFPVADRVFPRVISLPLFSRMTTDDVDRVAGALHAILN